VPGQWQWGKLEVPTAASDWLCAAVVSTAYLTLASLGSRWIENGKWRQLLLLGLVCAGVATQVSMQQLGFGLGKWPFVLYSSSSSGYYTAAKQDVRSAQQFLADYDRIQEMYREQYGPLHLATHPPGLIVLQHALIWLCEGSPTLTRVLLEMRPRAVIDGFRDVAAGGSITATDQAAIWLLAIMSQLASGLAVLPIYFLARRGVEPRGAWTAAALWPLVPAMTIFMPKSDVLYPLFAVTCIWFLVTGRTIAGRLVAGAAAGITLWLGMFLSLGMISVGPIVLFTAMFCEGLARERIIASALQRLAGVLITVSVASLLLWSATGLWLPLTWWRCYRIHATFYDPSQIGSSRTYWPWVGLNLVEFGVATGIPLIIAAIVGTAWLFNGRVQSAEVAELADDPARKCEERGCLFGVVAGWWLTLFALDVSGKNLGEVARLWMFLMPFACVAAAPALRRLESRRWVAFLLLLQLIQTATFAANIQGFFDPSSVKVGLELGGTGRGG
jgi:hypothetical protein